MVNAKISMLVGSVVMAAFALTGCAASTDGDATPAQSTAAALDQLPKIPAALAVPAGNALDFRFDGVGVQIYKCLPSATSYAWTFQAPQANLLDEGELEGTHFAGPTWKSNDGSSVVGTKLAAATVDSTSIPWLLLQAASHAGSGKMSRVTFIQRLETVGGLAPASGCSAAQAGAVANVHYTATYAFYKHI